MYTCYTAGAVVQVVMVRGVCERAVLGGSGAKRGEYLLQVRLVMGVTQSQLLFDLCTGKAG